MRSITYLRRVSSETNFSEDGDNDNGLHSDDESNVDDDDHGKDD